MLKALAAVGGVLLAFVLRWGYLKLWDRDRPFKKTAGRHAHPLGSPRYLKRPRRR